MARAYNFEDKTNHSQPNFKESKYIKEVDYEGFNVQTTK